MITSFDYYKQVENPDMYLCNPDKRFLCALNGENRHLILRFNDLSELTFTVPKIKEKEDEYNLIESKRLIYIDKIGWFQIIDATEIIEGEKYSKSVTAQSHQSVLKNRGFVTEERLYMFYNPNDPLDDRYDASNKAAIPSVVGQLSKQLGIKVALSSRDMQIDEAMDDWTLVYIDPILHFHSKSYGEMYVPADSFENICRGFDKNDDLNGYDFIINQVENAFEVVFEFDYLYHTIKVKPLSEITKPTNIYLSFDNIVNSLSISEKAEDIVTIMTCNGKDLDIRTVNPMGTNYIANFDYYKKRKSDDGKIEYPWMSKGLIDTLNEWEVEFEKWQNDDDNRTGHTKSFSSLVEDIQKLYVQKTEADEQIQYANLKLTDMQVARDQFLAGEDEAGNSEGYITAEEVKIDKNSLMKTSLFFSTAFTENASIVGHINQPKPSKTENSTAYTFKFEDDGVSGTPKSLIENYIDTTVEEDEEVTDSTPLYFMDGDEKSYCKLEVSSEIGVVKDNDGNIAEAGVVEIRGFKIALQTAFGTFYVTLPEGTQLTLSQSNPYFIYNGNRFKIVKSADGVVSVYCYYVSGFSRYTTYSATAGDDGWCSIWENHIINKLVPQSEMIDNDIRPIEDEMKYINEQCNIEKFVKKRGDSLYNELSNYWIEGDYQNDNIAVFDTTTITERIDFAKELMKAGEIDLAKCAQPQFEMSVNAINFIKMYDFRQFTNELELGRVITIEKSEDVLYYPALMSIEYDLDTADSFSMTFSNASKPNETTMTFADLLKEASSTSRTVSANWSNLTDYAKNKEQITSLINAPLDRSLRAMQASLASQAFIIDENGILGRKYDKGFDETEKTFSPEQIRIVNNQIIFTKDNWETAALALGKNDYGYGLVADVLIGELILGQQISIGSNSERVTINDDGIIIKNDNKEVVFEADEIGNITLKGTITADRGEIGGYIIDKDTFIGNNVGLRSNRIVSKDGVMQIAETNEEANPIAFWAGDSLDNIENAPFQVYRDGSLLSTNADITGAINAAGGRIGDFNISNDNISSIDDNIIIDSANSTIKVANIQCDIANISNTMRCKTITPDIISNTSNTASFDFIFSTKELEDVFFTCSLNKGNSASVTISANKILTADVSISCTISYKTDKFWTLANGEEYRVNRRNYDTVMRKGSKSATISGIPLTNGSYSAGLFGTYTYKISSASVTPQNSVQLTSSGIPTIGVVGELTPKTSGAYALGTPEYKWKDIYLLTDKNGSDRKIKKDIKDLSEDLSYKIIRGLTPRTYKFKSFNTPRDRAGFIAQEVEELLLSIGLTTEDLALVSKSKPTEPDNEDNHYTIEYKELIAPLVKVVQSLINRVNELEKFNVAKR